MEVIEQLFYNIYFKYTDIKFYYDSLSDVEKSNLKLKIKIIFGFICFIIYMFVIYQIIMY